MIDKNPSNNIFNIIGNLVSFNFSVLSNCLILLFYLGSTQILYPQQNKQYYIPDSLKNYSYKELSIKQIEHIDDNLKHKIYSLAYLHKAKNEQDTIRMANGYSQLCSGVNYSNELISLKYNDSIIALTKYLNNKHYPGFAYMTNGMIYYSIGEFQESLFNYLIAHEIATKHQNSEQLIYIKKGIAAIKWHWGDEKEALEIIKSSLNVLKNLNEIDDHEYLELRLGLLLDLSNLYIANKKLDSALMYTRTGLKESKTLKDSDWYYTYVATSGEIAYYKNNFQSAIDSITNAIPYFEDGATLFDSHRILGLAYKQLSDSIKTFSHFRKADSIYNKFQNIKPEVREVQEFFVEYYKNKQDTENQLKYIDRLLYVDSIIDANYRTLGKTLNKKFDTPQLMAEKEKIIEGQSKQVEKDVVIIYRLVLLIIMIAIFGIWSYKKQQGYKKRFDQLVSKSPKIIQPKSSIASSIKGLSPEIVKNVLTALNEFEKNEGFLDNSVSLNSLAKTGITNANYLSKIINAHKNKNFSTYISDLRIDACIEKLKKDPVLRKYAIKAIAFEVGFNNTESFSKAFFKRTGIYPSFFIKELEKHV